MEKPGQRTDMFAVASPVLAKAGQAAIEIVRELLTRKGVLVSGVAMGVCWGHKLLKVGYFLNFDSIVCKLQIMFSNFKIKITI